MPIFGNKRHQRNPELNGHSNLPSLSPPVMENASKPQLPSLVFQCQQAHGSPTILVSGFTNMRELYGKIAEGFQFPASDILYCTLNTHKVDMTKLLGGQIGLDDFIFVHRKGQPKEVELTKTDPYLGLTITDNGNGYAFIKKIKEGSSVDQIKFIEAGDHIEKINDVNMVNRRHYEVANALKSISVGTTFKIRLVEPLRAGFANIGPRIGISNKKQSGIMGTGKETLRFRAKGPVTVEQAPTEVMEIAMAKINSLLESFMGINDNELAAQIWETGGGINNPHEFVVAINNSDLQAFAFSEDFIFDLWGAISDAKTGRLKKINE